VDKCVGRVAGKGWIARESLGLYGFAQKAGRKLRH